MRRLFILLLIVSCQGNTEKSTEETTILDELPNQSDLKAYCFYKLDDKYCEVSDSTLIQNWKADKSAALKHNDVRGNLFEHKGGGPNGAEWNPSTSIYIVVNQYNTNFELLQNDLQYKYVTEVVDGYTWISITQSEWEERLVDITDKDWQVMFPNGPVQQSDEFGLQGAVQPPKTGQVIHFSFTNVSENQSYYFYAAFGE